MSGNNMQIYLLKQNKYKNGNQLIRKDYYVSDV